MNYLHKVAAIDTIINHMAETYNTDQPHIQKLIGLARDMKPAVSSLGVMHATPNPVDTIALHTKKVANGAGKLREKATSYVEKANAVLRDGLNDIQSRVDAKVNLKADDKYAAEIRAVFRSKPYTEQLEMLQTLCKENNGPALAAIVCAPAVLTGINKDLQTQFRDHIIAVNAPQEMAEQTALMEAVVPVLSVLKVAREVAESYSDPLALAKIETAEASANAAQAALADSVQD